MNAKISFISQLVMVLCMLLLPVSDALAKTGCCSRHGGVVGCDTRTGHLRCKDGTPSPTCPCEEKKGFFGGIMHPTKTMEKSKASTTTGTMTTTTIPATTKAKETKAKESKAKKTTTKTTEKFSTKGCCSRHGGVGRCDKSGYFMCKDKTVSSCRCK